LGAGANDKHIVDIAAADRGRAVWATQCINCHGTTTRGTDKGANLVRSDMMWSDRYGSDLGSFLLKGHPTQSGMPSSNLSKTQVEELSHFIHQRLYDTLRGSPIFNPQNVLTGNVRRRRGVFQRRRQMQYVPFHHWRPGGLWQNHKCCEHSATLYVSPLPYEKADNHRDARERRRRHGNAGSH
jgi:cytochrome c553